MVYFQFLNRLAQQLKREVNQLKERNRSLENALKEKTDFINALKVQLEILRNSQSQSSQNLLNSNGHISNSNESQEKEEDNCGSFSYIATKTTPSRQFVSYEPASSDSDSSNDGVCLNDTFAAQKHGVHAEKMPISQDTFNDSDTDISVDNGDVDLPRLTTKKGANKTNNVTSSKPASPEATTAIAAIQTTKSNTTSSTSITNLSTGNAEAIRVRPILSELHSYITDENNKLAAQQFTNSMAKITSNQSLATANKLSSKQDVEARAKIPPIPPKISLTTGVPKLPEPIVFAKRSYDFDLTNDSDGDVTVESSENFEDREANKTLTSKKTGTAHGNNKKRRIVTAEEKVCFDS